MSYNVREKHPQAGQTVTLNDGVEYRIEDYWQNVYGQSWQTSKGNMACLQYAMATAGHKIPLDNEVVYGKIGMFGHLVHCSELPGGENYGKRFKANDSN